MLIDSKILLKDEQDLANKGDLEVPVTKQSLLDQLAKPVTQEEWLKGYNEWKRKQLAND